MHAASESLPTHKPMQRKHRKGREWWAVFISRLIFLFGSFRYMSIWDIVIKVAEWYSVKVSDTTKLP
ncbi:hypothetical protein BH11BAC3_BH11BAC3_19030 [soil metagenome]